MWKERDGENWERLAQETVDNKPKERILSKVRGGGKATKISKWGVDMWKCVSFRGNWDCF